MMSELYSPNELADELGCSVAFLAQRRYMGDGPKFIKMGARKVRYRRVDVEAWLAARTTSRTAAS